MFQFRKFARRKDDTLGLIEGDVTAGIGADNARVNVAAAHVRARVHMGDEADSGQGLVGVGRESGHEVAVFVEGNILQAHLAEFALKIFGKLILTGS